MFDVFIWSVAETCLAVIIWITSLGVSSKSMDPYGFSASTDMEFRCCSLFTICSIIDWADSTCAHPVGISAIGWFRVCLSFDRFTNFAPNRLKIDVRAHDGLVTHPGFVLRWTVLTLFVVPSHYSPKTVQEVGLNCWIGEPRNDSFKCWIFPQKLSDVVSIGEKQPPTAHHLVLSSNWSSEQWQLNPKYFFVRFFYCSSSNARNRLFR